MDLNHRPDHISRHLPSLTGMNQLQASLWASGTQCHLRLVIGFLQTIHNEGGLLYRLSYYS